MGRAVPRDDHRERHVCTKCGFVHYLDPKVACGTIAERDGKMVLIQRAIEPRKGSWSFPCGFMEIDETTEQAAARETLEETGLEVRLGPLLGAYSYADSFWGGAILVVVYRAEVTGGVLKPDTDVCDARWIGPSEIPWEKLAFQSSTSAMRDWLRAGGHAVPPGVS